MNVAAVSIPSCEQTTIFNTPQAFIDKRGEPILIRLLSDDRRARLVQMYLNYRPRDDFAGLPPVKDEDCKKWVEGMMNTGINIVAVCFEEGIVGHAALFPMGNGRYELFIVVAREKQNIGIGTPLTRTLIQLAYELEFDEIWLSVETKNRIAQHVYAKCGFGYLERNAREEVDMGLKVKRYHKWDGFSVSDLMNPNVITIREDQTCQEALAIFLDRGVASLPVLDQENRVVGILSETDLISAGNFHHKVTDIFTRQVITVEPDCTLSKVVRLFQSRRIRCIPVLDKEKRLLAVVGRKDLLIHYTKQGK